MTERVQGEYSVVVQAQQNGLEVKAKTGRLLKPISHWRGEKTPRCVRCKVVLCLLSTITVLIMKEAQVAFTYCGSDSVFKSEGVNKCVIWDAATKIQFQTPFSSKTMRLISSITQKANEKGIDKLYHNVIQCHTAKVSTYYKTGISIRHQCGQRKEATNRWCVLGQ